MKHAMKKKTIVCSLGIAGILCMVTLTSTVAFQSVAHSEKLTSSPLFQSRLNSILSQGRNPSFSSLYIGKERSVDILLPAREVLSRQIINQLSSDEVYEKLRCLDSDLCSKWREIVLILENNLAEINRIIRQDFTSYQRLYTEFSSLSDEQVTQRFLEQIHMIDLQTYKQNEIGDSVQFTTGNITTRPICNITSGQFCQITTQPICQITTQPICLITKGFFCWTIYGPICPTTGIKCHPPTSRPILCSIFAAAGKILKAIIIVVLLATVIFVPLAVLSLVFITVFNPERCEQIHQKITLWLNCTTPE